MDSNVADIVRAWSENTETVYRKMIKAVMQSIRDDFGWTEMPADAYADTYRHRHAEIIDHLVPVVRDVVYAEAMRGLPDKFGRSLFVDLLELSDRRIWSEVAESFVPEPDDYAAFVGEV